MGLNCVLQINHREDITQMMSINPALAALLSIFRSNCLKISPDFNPFLVLMAAN